VPRLRPLELPIALVQEFDDVEGEKVASPPQTEIDHALWQLHDSTIVLLGQTVVTVC